MRAAVSVLISRLKIVSLGIQSNEATPQTDEVYC
jgi:hypothetical protein